MPKARSPPAQGLEAQGSRHPVRAAKYMRHARMGATMLSGQRLKPGTHFPPRSGTACPPRLPCYPGRFRGGRRGGATPRPWARPTLPSPPGPACGKLDSRVEDRSPGTACVPGTQTRPEALRTLQKDPELVCPEHVPLPSLPASQRQTGWLSVVVGRWRTISQRGGGAEELGGRAPGRSGAPRALGPRLRPSWPQSPVAPTNRRTRGPARRGGAALRMPRSGGRRRRRLLAAAGRGAN